MTSGLPHTTLRDSILTHPTLVEGRIPLSLFASKAESTAKDNRTGLLRKDVSPLS